MGIRFIKTAVLIAAAAVALWPGYAADTVPEQYAFFESAVREVRLQNGLAVFIIEDFSDALIRIEYTVRAGYADQNSRTAGYVPLYVRLFAEAGNGSREYARHLNASCTQTAARYTVTVTPPHVRPTLEYLAECAFDPLFTDESIARTAAELSRQLTAIERSPEGFINTVINRTVFKEQPYRYATGIPADVFAGKTPAQMRTILDDISRTLYAPANGALFISGAINAEEAERLAAETFGRYGTVPANDASRSAAEAERRTRERRGTTETDEDTPAKRFVLVDESFSKNIQQIVLQYVADPASHDATFRAARNVFAADDSDLIRRLISDGTLGIGSTDYASIVADSSYAGERLIVQVLAGSHESPAEQAIVLARHVRNAYDNLLAEPERLAGAFRTVQTEDRARYADAATYLSALAERFGAASDSAPKGKPPENAQDEPEEPGEPFIFVLAHPSVYATYKKSFVAEGFVAVSRDDLRKPTRAPQTASQTAPQSAAHSEIADKSANTPALKFAAAQRVQTAELMLSNGVPLIVKRTPNSSRISFVLEIIGGEVGFGATYEGLESILIQAVARNLTEAAAAAAADGAVTRMPTVSAETGPETSYIRITCDTVDFEQCLKAAADALIFGDISPAMADELVYAREYRARRDAADTAMQMQNAALQLIYADTAYESPFRTDPDGTTRIPYATIAAAYPRLLDASRYRLIAVGGEPEETAGIADLCETYFGVFSPFPVRAHGGIGNETVRKKEPSVYAEPQFPRTERYVRLRRIFSAEAYAAEAPHEPPVLVPTTEFADPVQYYAPAPRELFEQTVYNALLYELERRLNDDVAKGKIPATSVRVHAASPRAPYGAVRFTGIPRTFDIDAALYGTASALYESLRTPESADRIRNEWIRNELAQTSTNEGTVHLIAESLLNTGTSCAYADAYVGIESANQNDFATVMERWLLTEPPVRLYSASRR